MPIAYTYISGYIVTVELGDLPDFNKIDNENKTFSVKNFKIIQIEDFDENTIKNIENYAVNKKYVKYINVNLNKNVIKFSNFQKNFPENYSKYTGNVVEYFQDSKSNGYVCKEYFLINGKLTGTYKQYNFYEPTELTKEFNYIDDKLHGICTFYSHFVIHTTFDMDKLVDYKFDIKTDGYNWMISTWFREYFVHEEDEYKPTKKYIIFKNDFIEGWFNYVNHQLTEFDLKFTKEYELKQIKRIF
jgi:hypothetical protein